jgi:hypothetical protein
MSDSNLKPMHIDKLGSVAKSKQEIYLVLTTKGGLYLSLMDRIDLNYLRAILQGTKKALVRSYLCHILPRKRLTEGYSHTSF